MVAITQWTGADTIVLGYFNARQDAEKWIADLMAEANVAARVGDGQYSPLRRSSFRVAEVSAEGISKRIRRRILSQQFGGWASEETLSFVAERDRKAGR